MTTHLEEFVDVEVVTAVEIHEVQGLINVRKPLFAVLAHHTVEQRAPFVELFT